MPTAPARPLVAIDANVVMDLGEESESVLDALATIRQRLRSPRIVIPPTAKLEVQTLAWFIVGWPELWIINRHCA